jgi:hypothetical protein
MNESLRRFVRHRARERCEYCHFPEAFAFLPFQIDHIIAEKHHGKTTRANLAWTCYYCNSYKGPNIAGIDPREIAPVRLFHPRRDPWHEHFEWSRVLLKGRTPIGRVTVDVLNINEPDALAVRRWLVAMGEALT